MNLKSKGPGEQRFAYLIEPTTPVANDRELYQAVAKAGRAIIRPFKGWTYELLPPISLTPSAFEAEWQGD